MEELHFNGLKYLHFLWAVPALAAFYIAAYRWKSRALKRFAEAGTLPRINIYASRARQARRAALVIIAVIFIVIALTRPAWKAEPEEIRRTGRDVVFVVDVSSSMLATDIKPNRLMLAKLAISDTLEVITGDRVALVAFAGNAVVKCPLTFDYGFFRSALEDLRPDSVSRAGTRIGDAIRVVMEEIFTTEEAEFKDIILITDGEDHDSFPVNAAEDAGKTGTRIIAIGLGDHEKGTRIPVEDERGNIRFMKDSAGNYVFSRLDWDTLRKMAAASNGGRPYRVGAGEALDLASIYTRLVGEAEKTEHGIETAKRYRERFQPFLAIAFLLLCVEMAAGERRRA